MRWVLNILGIILILAGTTFILQGTGVYPVGMMANNMLYTYIGAAIDLVAIIIFIVANRKKQMPPSV